jgi:hypothetical protein
MTDITKTSRRALLAGVPAAVLATAAPALASALSESAPAVADPIFEAIAEHRRSLDHMFACYRTGRGLERGLPRLPARKEHWFHTAWSHEPPANCIDPPEWIAAQLAIGETCAATSRRSTAEALPPLLG